MVLVVADDPRGKKKFGSEVTGPATIAILREALGVTIFGEVVTNSPAGGVRLSASREFNSLDHPWATDLEANTPEMPLAYGDIR
jgi:hypothetical protein